MDVITVTNVDPKPTGRLKKYITGNKNLVQIWLENTLRMYLIQKIYYLAFKDTTEKSLWDTYDYCVVPATYVERSRKRHRLYQDIMCSYYGLGYRSDSLQCGIQVEESVIDGLIKDKGVKPDLESRYSAQGILKRSQTYVSFVMLTLPEIIYIYEHIDEFDFRLENDDIYGSIISRYRLPKFLCVLNKNEIDYADEVSFRNSIDTYYIKDIETIGKVVMDKDLTYLRKTMELPDSESKNKAFALNKDAGATVNSWGKSFLDEYTFDSTKEINQDTVSKSIEELEGFIDILSKKKQAYQDILNFINKSGGDEKFKKIYYEKIIDHFYQCIPLNLNSNNPFLKDMCQRACKKRYNKI